MKMTLITIKIIQHTILPQCYIRNQSINLTRIASVDSNMLPVSVLSVRFSLYRCNSTSTLYALISLVPLQLVCGYRIKNCRIQFWSYCLIHFRNRRFFWDKSIFWYFLNIFHTFILMSKNVLKIALPIGVGWQKLVHIKTEKKLDKHLYHFYLYAGGSGWADSSWKWIMLSYAIFLFHTFEIIKSGEFEY